MPQLKKQRKLQEKHTYSSRKLQGNREGLKQVLPIKWYQEEWRTGTVVFHQVIVCQRKVPSFSLHMTTLFCHFFSLWYQENDIWWNIHIRLRSTLHFPFFFIHSFIYFSNIAWCYRFYLQRCLYAEVTPRSHKE